MKKCFIFFVIFFSACTAETGMFCVREFQHVEEIPKKWTDGYTLIHYEEESLDSIEVIVLKEIMDNNNLDYFISSDNKLFCEKFLIEKDFLIDRQLIDTIIYRQLPYSNFVKMLVVE